MCSAAWGDDILVPSPVYFNDFSTAVSGKNGIEIIGNGVFENDADPRFGRIFHNDPGDPPTKAVRTNYLKLPSTVLSHSGSTKQMTIGFWVNKKNAADFYWSPLFTAYNDETRSSNGTEYWPMFSCLARKVVGLNCWGYCDLGDTYNDNQVNAVHSNWLDDGQWHYYTITLTSTKVKVYVDGVVENSWTVDGTSPGQVINGLFNAGADAAAATPSVNALDYICLGGNQSSALNDPDPAFGFDDFAVYDEALTAEQIAKIISYKLIQGTPVGKLNYSSGYLEDMSTKMTLTPGTSFNYKFINYYGGANWKNWHLVVFAPNGDKKIVLRTDWWDDQNGTTNEEHQRGFSTDDGLNYWDNVPSKMDGAEVDMTITFTSDKKFTMQSRTTKGETSWSYDYTSNYASTPINLSELNSIDVALSVNGNYLDLLSTSTEVYETINVLGWSTYASDYALDFTSEIDGLTPYIVTNHTGSAITLSKVTTTVPAGTPLLLKGTAGTSYTIPVAASSDTDVSSNKLVRGTGSAVSYEAENTKYVLSASGSDPVFKKIIDGTPATVPTNKAYLQFNEVIAARELTFDFNDDITGVNEVSSQKEQVKGEYFNIAGQRVAQPTKGLYIVNGKKVVIR